jgi:hypothetical protein
MNQEFIERMFEYVVESFDYAIQRDELDSQIEHLRSTSKSLISIITLFNEEGIEDELISEDVLKANIERKTNLEKIYLSLDEVRPDWLFDEMKTYAYFASQISKARRNGTIKKVDAKVIEKFKA